MSKTPKTIEEAIQRQIEEFDKIVYNPDEVYHYLVRALKSIANQTADALETDEWLKKIDRHSFVNYKQVYSSFLRQVKQKRDKWFSKDV